MENIIYISNILYAGYSSNQRTLKSEDFGGGGAHVGECTFKSSFCRKIFYCTLICVL